MGANDVTPKHFLMRSLLLVLCFGIITFAQSVTRAVYLLKFFRGFSSLDPLETLGEEMITT